jgi:hypothetical protein
MFAGLLAAPAFLPAQAPVAKEDTSIVYVNQKYRFRFTLPSSWKGYTIFTNSRPLEAQDAPGQSNHPAGILVTLSIRHPLWTEQNPRQDIPIMIFTHKQWELVQQEKIIVSAAPFPPSELGRNTRYVFALPPRYNFAFPTGYEEVEKILQGKPLKISDSGKSKTPRRVSVL